MTTKTLFETTLAAALAVAATFSAASAQASVGPQPYNPNDPQNYSAPALEAYQQEYPQQVNQPQQSASTPQDEAAYQAGQEAIAQAPPEIPAYDQPEVPGPGYIWTPGYWAWGPAGYYWVQGAWVQPPYAGALWTPGYWGQADDGFYFWNAGYWGPAVGFYGGINYGFGYFGTGFYGGYWRGPIFFYNTAYWHCGRWGARYGYVQRIPGVVAFRAGGPAFVTHRVAVGLPGGTAFGARAAVPAYRARFAGAPGYRGAAIANGARPAVQNQQHFAVPQGHPAAAAHTTPAPRASAGSGHSSGGKR